MSLALVSTLTAILPGLTSSFGASGGTPPYAYAVIGSGAGGTIDPASGLYQAPAVMGSTPQTLFDTIQVTDSAMPTPAVVTAQILVGTPLFLFCDIIQNQLGLANDHIYVWDQKLSQPTDSSLYVAVSVPRVKPFANNRATDSTGENTIQTANFMATLDLDIISRGPAARDRKEEIILALDSQYSQNQQVANGFLIGKLPPNAAFINLSQIDGAAIPYRFRISVNMQYAVTKIQAVDYYTSFSGPTVSVNP